MDVIDNLLGLERRRLARRARHDLRALIIEEPGREHVKLPGAAGPRSGQQVKVGLLRIAHHALENLRADRRIDRGAKIRKSERQQRDQAYERKRDDADRECGFDQRKSGRWSVGGRHRACNSASNEDLGVSTSRMGEGQARSEWKERPPFKANDYFPQ